jgi:hypothetical protein
VPQEHVSELPPLILHPFDTRVEAVSLADSAIGLHPDLNHLESRFSELRMLSFLGKDLDRWLAQCVEFAERRGGELERATEGSFLSLLLFDPPEAVTRKLSGWKIGNYQIVFTRALGLNLVYPFPPGREGVSETLLRNFHHYADELFDLRMKMKAGPELRSDRHTFEIYASSEYSRLLARSWGNPTS